jgi:hypothetical protein
MLDMEGNRADEFDQFIRAKVKEVAAPAFRKLATGECIDEEGRAGVALFIGITAARSPEMMRSVMDGLFKSMEGNVREELNELTRVWCEHIGRPFGEMVVFDFLKPSQFGGIWLWAQSFQDRLLKWKWHLFRTTRDQPFVTSDMPVFAQWDPKQDFRLVSFPVSSEYALMAIHASSLSTTLPCTSVRRKSRPWKR